MASTVPAVPASGAKEDPPLSSFARVSKIVYLYRPSTDRNPSGSSSSSSPKLILVGGWMDAREAHLAKYTAMLQALFPASPILLVRSFRYHFTGQSFPDELEPAVLLIRSILAEAAEAENNNDTHDGDDDNNNYNNNIINKNNNNNNNNNNIVAGESKSSRRPEMLIQVFSNGGSAVLSLLYDLYRRSAVAAAGDVGHSATAVFPPHVTVFDSGPGLFHFRRSITAFTLAVAKRSFIVRLLVKSLIVCLCAVYWVRNVPWGRPGFLDRIWLAHNDPARNGSEVRRVYLYSREDQLVDYRDIEKHAAQARQRGYEARLEEFARTPHVAHVRGNEVRYRSILEQTWGHGEVGLNNIDRTG